MEWRQKQARQTGMLPVRRITQTRTNFWRRLLRLASAV
jgi:hypothetical protein